MGNVHRLGKITGCGIRGAGCGKVAALMRRKYIWGFYTDECEKPVQIETFKAPQALGAVCEAD